MSEQRSNARTDLRAKFLIGASALAAVAAYGAPALAQDGAEEDDTIVVTGSRLARRDFDAVSPVTTVGSEQLELTATLTTEQLLNELPQIVPGNMRTSNNAGGYDYPTVDLRGLGANRTLVLVDGERVPSSSTDGAVDLNTIPASLIERIEVVTGGASTVYGSDAISGVVNFILKDDYEGAEFNVTYGSELETGNAAEFEMNALVGGNFANGRGNITAYASYYNREAVMQSEYDYSALSSAVCYNSGSGSYYACDSNADVGSGSLAASGGSGTAPWGTVYNNTSNPFQNLDTLLPANFAAGNTDTNCDGVAGSAYSTGNLSFNDAGELTPRNASGYCSIPDRSTGSSRYNYAPDNMLIVPAERIALTASGNYEVAPNITLNFLANYTNTSTEVQLAATPATGLTITLNDTMSELIETNHPDLWAALQSRADPTASFTMDRRMNEVGTRNAYYESNSLYFMTSLVGENYENVDWNLSASYGQVSFASRAVNSVNKTALLQGLAGCEGTNLLPGCVALDIFGPGTLTEEMVDFISVDTFTNTRVEEARIAGFVRGDVVELPAGPLSAVVGFEYRDTFSSQYNDNEQRTGNIFGFNAIQDQEGQVDVWEFYTEARLPILSRAPFAHYLGLEGGFRQSYYSSVGELSTYKIGGEWAPTSWLSFRAIFNEAARAPSVYELFQNGDQGFPTITDPCNDSEGNSAACIAAPGDAAVPAGVYPGYLQNNSQAQAFAYGNPDLTPETAETITYGFVLRPDWFPIGDFSASVDYFNIEIADAVSSLGAQYWLDDCYVNGNANGGCSRIVRDQNTGSIVSIDTTVANLDSMATEGYDIQLEWAVDLGPGRLTVNELYSILESYRINEDEYAGYTYSSIGSAYPDYKSVLSTTYAVGDWTLFGRWTYTPEIESARLAGTIYDAASYIDLSARWDVTEALSLTANIDNILDDYPPQTVDGILGGQANTDVQVYRVLGRTFAVSARYRF